MAYYLMVKDNKSYRPIDISSHSNFVRLSKYKGDKFSLEELDRFTSNYSDEINFKFDLFDRTLIEESDLYKNISIRMKSNGKYENVMYNLVFKDAIRYFDSEYLCHKIQSLSTDYNFLKKLVSHYRNSYVNCVTVDNIMSAINGNPEINLSYEWYKFVNKEIYEYKYNTETKKWEEPRLKYKSLHDLAMFIYNYENPITLTKKEKDNIIRETLVLAKEKNSLTKVKKRVMKTNSKKNYELDGQMTFL